MSRQSAKARLLQPLAARLLPFLLLVLAGLAPALSPSGGETNGRFGRVETPQTGQTAILAREALHGIRPALATQSDGQGGAEDDSPHAALAAAFPVQTDASHPARPLAGAASRPPARIRPQSPRAPPFLV